MLVVPFNCLAKVRVDGETEATPPLTPLPETPTKWMLPWALSLMTTTEERAHAPDGVKVTVMVQVPPGGKPVPQVLVCEKSEAFCPDNPRLVMTRGVVPA